MDDYSSLLLKIYRSARSVQPDEFPNVVMALLQDAIGFDSARLLNADFTTGSAVVQGSIMYNIVSDNALDWESIQRNDLAFHQVITQPNRPLSFHCPTLFASPQHAIMRDYADRYEHQNGLVMVLHDSDTGLTDGLSFYRADKDEHFKRREQNMMRAVMPHLQEALKLNRQIADSISTPSPRGVLLIANIDGRVQQCEPQAQRLMELEWLSWRPNKLPGPLMTALSTLGSEVYIGRSIVITFNRVDNVLFLRIKTQSLLANLSPRELEVACLYSKGLQAKAIAAQIGIAPVTVRNFLQRIYQKLQVHDKASLANVIAERQI